jgi:hypothetical protein
MIKKFLLLSLVASQLMVSCSSDESGEETTKPEKELTLEEQIANLVKQPYSKLTPTEQKAKLEVEANDMLVQLDKSKSSGAIEAIENLNRLLELNPIDIFNGKSTNGVEEALTVSGVYGVYTWNNTDKKWAITASSTELKFVFPAKASQTANNAIFTSKSTSSDIKVTNIDTYGDWGYNETTGQYGQISPDINDWFYLPTSVDAVLTIDGNSSATFTQTAKYSNGKQVPNEFAYKMVLNDGYTWEMSGTKAATNTSKASFTYNGKSLIEFTGGSSTQVDALLDNDALVQYRGKANGAIKIMDNFIIIADMDLATAATDDAALEKSTVRPAYPDESKPNIDFKAYYNSVNANEKKYSEGTAANNNKNMKLILVSKKDGTKIADLVQVSEKVGNDYVFNLPVWDAQKGYYIEGNESFSQPYLEEVYYLKFSDNTKVAMSAYFSEGFDKLETKITDFVKAFNK